MPSLPITWDANLPYIQVLTAASGGGGAAVKVAVISDHKASGTNGGTSTSGSWIERTLNTVESDPNSIVALASNKFTLQAGTYFIIGISPMAYAQVHRCKIYNVTASADVAVSTNCYQNQTYAAANQSIVACQVVLAAQAQFDLQYRCGNGVATNGLGVAATFGVDEVYGRVVIVQVA